MKVVNMNVRQVNRVSRKIATNSVQLGGKTVKVCGGTIKNTVKLNKAISKKVKLLKSKEKRIKKGVDKEKLKKAMNKAAAFAGKAVVKTSKSVANTAKSAASKGAKSAADLAGKAVDSIDNDTVRFAKKSYDTAKSAAKVSVKTAKTVGKTSAKTIKTTTKTVRTLATKKGRRQLVNSVKRRVANVKRNVRRAQKIAKNTAKVAKKTAKLTARIAKAAVQLVSRFIGFLISTMPWSLIILGVVAFVLLFIYLVSNCFAISLGAQERVAGWALCSSDEATDIDANILELAVRLETACENSFSNSMKQEITNFCSENATPKNIISYQIGSSSATIYPANGADSQINALIDSLISSSSTYSSKYYSDFMAALVVLMTRAHGTEEDFALEKFTVEDMSKLIGGLNSNSCEYGSTFFVKTTSTTTGETCPGENCKKKTKPGCKCAEDENGNKYCAGHPYCDHDHKKLTVKLQTVEESTGKSISEIYNFSESETQYFNDVSSFISDLLANMSGGGESSQ